MKALKLKATLRESAPLVWRTLLLHPEADLEELNDLLLIAFGWDDEFPPLFITNDGPITNDDDEWFEADLREYFTAPGDLLSYSHESDDEYHVELELLAVAHNTDDAPLPRLTDGKNQAPPEGTGGLAVYARYLEALPDAGHPDHDAAADLLGTAWDPTAFDLDAVHQEITEFFDDDAELPEFDFRIFDEDDPSGPALLDTDEGENIPFKFEWLASEHGIKVTEADVRGTPREILDMRANLTEDDLASPEDYLALIEPLFKKFPDDPMLNFEIAGLYAATGDQDKSRRISRNLSSKFSDNFEVMVNTLLGLETPDDFMAEVNALPQPLDIRNHPAGKEGFYHIAEFLAFEELAIRAAVIRKDLPDAQNRLDRLVRFGFLHGDVEASAYAIATVILEKARQTSTELTPDQVISPTVSQRTFAIISTSLQECMLRGFG